MLPVLRPKTAAQMALVSSAGILYHLSSTSTSSLSTSADEYQQADTTPCLFPEMTSDPTKWSTRAIIESGLSTAILPTPLFWSGNYHGESTMSIADRCAPKSNSMTLNMLMCTLGIFVMPDWNGISSEGMELWDFAAEIFASHASGTAYTLVYNPRPTSVWLNVEMPALLANPGVDRIYQLDPFTCLPKCFWSSRASQGGEVNKEELPPCEGLPESTEDNLPFTSPI